MSPSLAANALLSLLSLPPGGAVVWPVMRDERIALVVKLDRRFWGLKETIPAQFEGYAVIVEPNVSLPAQTNPASSKLTSFTALARH